MATAVPIGGEAARVRLDAEGRYRDHGKVSYLVVGTYVVMLLLAVLVVTHSPVVSSVWAPWVLAALILFFLIRYLSTSYRLDDAELRAWRILGGRRVRLKDVRRIEFVSLRDLSPTGFFGSWGWRGRMWSASIGTFDSVYTDPAYGILITGGPEPLFISPSDPAGFARELSRRARSWTPNLEIDAGAPRSPTPSY